ncbi:hypothetical protein ACFQY5_25655 [Paeniroseomonas aquatica]|uniref:hypothetical protein n=1 Tax=Paeniroseomonas aquatica TaxID=373043 RepID=UPI003612A67E
MADPVLFTLAVLAILGTPGPTNSLLATAGATAGMRRSLPLIAAEAAGYALAILTIGLVLGPVMAGAPLLATALRVAVGATCCCWPSASGALAGRLWRRARW